MSVQQQNKDGSWSPAEPIQPTRILRIETWCRAHRLTPIANLLAAWDERGLG